MKKIISSVVGVFLFACFFYFVYLVLSSSFSGHNVVVNESTSTTTTLGYVGGDLGGGEARVRTLVSRLNGVDKLKEGASMCLELGSRGDYVIDKLGGNVLVSKGGGDCDVVVGINGDYFVSLEATTDPCAMIRTYYDREPKLAWITVMNNKKACSLGYVEAYKECFKENNIEQAVIEAACRLT